MMRNSQLVVLPIAAALFFACGDEETSDSIVTPIGVMGAENSMGGGLLGPAGEGDASGTTAENGSQMDSGNASSAVPPEPILVPEFGRTSERTIMVLARRSDGLSHPRDLGFDPGNPNNLWIVDRDFDGNVVLFDAGRSNQRIERMRDMAASHFMEEVSSISFSDQGTFSTCQESDNTMDGFGFSDDFMGPVLWSTDLMIHCNVNQTEGGPLNGSHLDMLHQSPMCMGVAHHQSNAFFVTDGANGHVVRYDFKRPHVPGGDDHSDGEVSRYPDMTFTRVPDIPSHLVLVGNELFYADTGAGAIRVGDISSGVVSRRLEADNEPLALFNEYTNVTVRTFAEGLDSPSGLVVNNDRVFVSLPTTGEIIAYALDGTEIERIDTGAPGVMGLELDGNGRLWFVNAYQGTVNMIEPGPISASEDTSPGLLAAPTQMGDCAYPDFGPEIGVGHVLPPYSWSGAREGNASMGGLRALDMFCGDNWQNVKVIVFVVVAEWMPWIDEYVGYIDALSPQIEQAGGRIVYVGGQNGQGALMDSSATDRLLANFTPRSSGIRVGALDNTYGTRLIDSGLITHQPSAFVVRRSDMRVLATQTKRMTEHLPYVEMAQDPDADWSNPGPATIVPIIPSNCEPGDDEIYEPNDTPDTAAVIGPDAFDGGVCARAGDFYFIDIQGPWRLELKFTHAVGDLDIALFEDGRILRDLMGQPVGPASSDDDEILDWQGPVTIYIYGYQGATAPYQLRLRTR